MGLGKAGRRCVRFVLRENVNYLRHQKSENLGVSSSPILSAVSLPDQEMTPDG